MRIRQSLDKPKSKVPASIVSILSWLGLLGIVFFINPNNVFVIPIFFLLFFTALFFTFSLALKSSRQGIILSTAVILFALLRFFGVGNLLNFILLTGIVIAVEIFVKKK